MKIPMFLMLLILLLNGCSTYMAEFSQPYRSDLEQIDYKKAKLIPYSDARSIVVELIDEGWAKNPWVNEKYGKARIPLKYENMVIATPQIYKKTVPKLPFTRSYYSFEVSLLGYRFIQNFPSSNSEAKKELMHKLENCVYVVKKSGVIKTNYAGIKELCTNTHYDRRRLMKALIALGADVPPGF